jgi:hypothetical protein
MRSRLPAPDPELIALRALAFIAGDPTNLGRFLTATGLGPANLRGAAREPGFLAAVLDHLATDESLLQAFAADSGLDAAEVASARERLGAAPQKD